MALRVCQVIVGASEGDAITNMALSIDRALSSVGAQSTLYAYWVHSRKLEARVGLLKDLPSEESVDLLVYHLSIGHEGVSDVLRSRNDRLVIVYHNITPPDRYRPWFSDLADDLHAGRNDLSFFSSRAVLALADSSFNAAELLRAGYRNVHTVAAGVDPSRLSGQPVDAPLLRTIENDFPSGFVLSVGQVLPHKRVEQTLETVHLLNSTHQMSLGLVVCGHHRLATYYRAVVEHAKSLPFMGVRFTGPVSDQHLATYYRAASCLLIMSDHEGLCIPPLEAMNVGLPVITKDVGAVRETVGDAAVVLPPGGGPAEAAEAIRLVLTESDLRHSLVWRGYSRVRELETHDHTERTVELMCGLFR